MSLNAKENRLFAKWKTRDEFFVPDGVVDDSAYSNSDKKLVFILKEINSGEFGFDLREYLKEDNARPQTWDNITRWVVGIRNLKADLHWNKLEDISKEDRINTLKSICAMNLRKLRGGYTSDSKKLAEYVSDNKEDLNKQYALYDPDLTICCGSGINKLFCDAVKFKNKPLWKSTKKGVRYFKSEPRKFIISYAHPEARVQDSILYYGLIDAVREIYGISK